MKSATASTYQAEPHHFLLPCDDQNVRGKVYFVEGATSRKPSLFSITNISDSAVVTKLQRVRHSDESHTTTTYPKRRPAFFIRGGAGVVPSAAR